MIILLIILPILVALTGVYIFRHNGKRQFLNLDVVQFIYSFVLMPIMFIWAKSFLFLIMRPEIGRTISVSQAFIIDSIYSLLFLFISAFVVIHSLTKSFELQRKKDPLVDIFELSEYFHLTVSHIVIFIGTLALIGLVAAVNIFVPITFVQVHGHFYWGILLGVLAGLLYFVGIGQYDEATRQFLRIMKLTYGLMFIIDAILYFIFTPLFSVMFGFYWISFFMSITLVFLAIFAEEPSEDHPRWLPFVIKPGKGLSIFSQVKYLLSSITR